MTVFGKDALLPQGSTKRVLPNVLVIRSPSFYDYNSNIIVGFSRPLSSLSRKDGWLKVRSLVGPPCLGQPPPSPVVSVGRLSVAGLPPRMPCLLPRPPCILTDARLVPVCVPLRRCTLWSRVLPLVWVLPLVSVLPLVCMLSLRSPLPLLPCLPVVPVGLLALPRRVFVTVVIVALLLRLTLAPVALVVSLSNVCVSKVRVPWPFRLPLVSVRVPLPRRPSMPTLPTKKRKFPCFAPMWLHIPGKKRSRDRHPRRANLTSRLNNPGFAHCVKWKFIKNLVRGLGNCFDANAGTTS